MTAYHPESNGENLERLHRTLTEYLRRYQVYA